MDTDHMNSKRLIAVAVVALGLAAPAWADLDGVKEMLRQGDNTGALEELETLAYGGDPDAMVLLGDWHHEGNGVATNFSLAWSWYNRAARQSNADAQYKLGRMLMRGEGAPHNEIDALEWIEQAAEDGHEQAQLEAGLIYRDGTRQIYKSANKALRYLTAAASQGNAEAELALEELYEQGLAPREELERFRAEQAVREMDEPDRIRAAIIAWIDSMNSQFEGSELGPRPQVLVTEVDDHFEVQIPNLVVTTGSAESIRFGTVELMLTPIGDMSPDPTDDWMSTRRYRLDMTPPSRIELQRGLEVYALTYEASDITGVWLPAIYSFVQTNVQLRNLEVTDQTGQLVAKAERGSWVANLQEAEPGTWSGPYGIEVSNMEITPPEGGKVTLARFSTETTVNGVRVEPYGRMINQMKTDPEGFINELIDPASGSTAITEMIELITSSRGDIVIEDLAYADPQGEEMFTLAKLSFGGGVSQNGTNSANFSISYEHAGLNVPLEGAEAALLPKQTRLALEVDRIPLENLARGLLEMFGAAMVEVARADTEAAMSDGFSEAELQGQVLNIVSEAKTAITVDLMMQAALSSLNLTGGVEANLNAAFGAAGAFDLTISDPDAVLAMIEQDPMMAGYKDVFVAFEAIAEKQPGSDGGTTSKFAIVVQPDGNVMVNGEDAMAIFGNAMMPAQEN